MKNGKVIFPGTFDPFTLGHLDVLYRLADIFEKVYISVAVNLEKSPTFTTEERINMIKKVVGENDTIEIVSISGLVTEYMKQNDIRVLARGIRDSEDLYYELKMSRMNKLLYPEMDTIFLHTSEIVVNGKTSLGKKTKAERLGWQSMSEIKKVDYRSLVKEVKSFDVSGLSEPYVSCSKMF